MQNLKRSRNEVLSSVLGSYLRRRRYSDQEAFKKSDLKFNYSLTEMALNHMLQNEVSSRNSFCFSSLNIDANIIDQQFNRFKSFVGDASEPMKNELTYFIFPMYLYLHLELVISGQIAAALKFYQKYAFLFVGKSMYQAVLDDIVQFHTTENFETNVTLSMLRCNQYEVSVSSDTLLYLHRFLKTYKQTFLLQVLNKHICLKITSGEENDNYQENTNNFKENELKENPSYDNALPSDCDKDNENKALGDLNNAMQKLKESPPLLPSICHYALNSPNVGVSSIDLTSNQSLLAAGFEDSSVRIWNLTPSPLQNKPAEIDISNLKLESVVEDTNETFSDTSQSTSKVLRGHCGNVFDLQFTSNNQTLLSCSEDASIRAWSMDTFTNVCIYQGHNYPIWCMDISPYDLYFVTGSHDRTARLWTLDRTFAIRVFTGHNMDVDCVKFHPNCNYVATGSSDRTVRLWDVQQGTLVRSFSGHRSSVMAIAFSPDGKLVASGGEDKRIKVWDIASGSLLKDLRGHTDTVYSIVFSSDSSVIASGGADEYVRIWNISKTGNLNYSRSDGYVSPECMHHQKIKSTTIHFLHYTTHNILYTSGTTS